MIAAAYVLAIVGWFLTLLGGFGVGDDDLQKRSPLKIIVLLLAGLICAVGAVSVAVNAP